MTATPPPYQPPQQQPQHHPQQPHQPPPAFVDLTLQGSVMTSSLVPPSVRVNGYPVPTSYGLNHVPVPPGPVRVDVSCQWMRTYGQATLTGTLGPGQRMPVFYAVPWHQFTRGAIGHEPQKRPGGTAAVVTLTALVLLVLAVVFLGALL